MDDAALDPLETLRRALRGARNRQLVLACILLGFAGLIASAFEREGSLGSRLFSTLGAVLFAAAGALLAWVALVKLNPDRSPLVVALRERPEHVVWIYAQDIQVKVNGIDAPVRDANVIARLADGSTVAITVKKDRAEPLLSALAALAPQSVRGYSPDREARFKHDPRSLT